MFFLESGLKFPKVLFFHEGRVGDVAETALPPAEQVTEEVAKLTNQTAVGLVNADEPCAVSFHLFENHLVSNLLPEQRVRVMSYLCHEYSERQLNGCLSRGKQ
jgi:hypothetical protein